MVEYFITLLFVSSAHFGSQCAVFCLDKDLVLNITVMKFNSVKLCSQFNWIKLRNHNSWKGIQTGMRGCSTTKLAMSVFFLLFLNQQPSTKDTRTRQYGATNRDLDKLTYAYYHWYLKYRSTHSFFTNRNRNRKRKSTGGSPRTKWLRFRPSFSTQQGCKQRRDVLNGSIRENSSGIILACFIVIFLIS